MKHFDLRKQFALMLLYIMALSFTYAQSLDTRAVWDYPIIPEMENSMESHDEMLDAWEIQGNVESFKK